MKILMDHFKKKVDLERQKSSEEEMQGNPYAWAIARILIKQNSEDKQKIIKEMLEYCQIRTLRIIERAMFIQNCRKKNDRSDLYEKFTDIEDIKYINNRLKELLSIDSGNEVTSKEYSLKNEQDKEKLQGLKTGSEFMPLHYSFLMSCLIENTPKLEENNIFILTISSERNDVQPNYVYEIISSCFISSSASFKLTKQSYEKLKEDDLPEFTLTKLKRLENQLIIGKEKFLDAIEKVIGNEKTDINKLPILKSASSSDKYFTIEYGNGIAIRKDHKFYAGNPPIKNAPYDDLITYLIKKYNPKKYQHEVREFAKGVLEKLLDSEKYNIIIENYKYGDSKIIANKFKSLKLKR